MLFYLMEILSTAAFAVTGAISAGVNYHHYWAQNRCHQMAFIIAIVYPERAEIAQPLFFPKPGDLTGLCSTTYSLWEKFGGL
jgi:hypothetical protein